MSNRAYYEKNTMLYAHPLTKGWYNYNTTKQRAIVCTSELNARHEAAKIFFNTEAHGLQTKGKSGRLLYTNNHKVMESTLEL